MKPPLPVVVLISGRGSNLHAIIDAITAGKLPAVIRAVISNRHDAPGLQRPALLGITTVVIDHTCYPGRVAFEAALRTTIDTFEPGLLVLAGFMRILSPEFVAHYRGRLVNIHPSLLPEFPGLNTHQRVLDAGKGESGATVHFVTAEVDGGPAILQARVPVLPDDGAASLAKRVLEQEHRILPLAIRWFAEERVRLDATGRILFDGAPLEKPWRLQPDAREPV
jgi:phosphoribosylglycinamide formyltransferase-1